MKKYIITLAILACGIIGVSACKNLTWSQVQTQVASWFTLKDTTAVIVTNVISKHPETLDLFAKFSEDIKQLSTKDVLTLDDLKADLQRRVADSDIYCKTDVLIAIDKIFDNISSDPQFDIATHKQELLDIAAGIDWAVDYHKGQATNPVPTPEETIPTK